MGKRFLHKFIDLGRDKMMTHQSFHVASRVTVGFVSPSTFFAEDVKSETSNFFMSSISMEVLIAHLFCVKGSQDRLLHVPCTCLRI